MGNCVIGRRPGEQVYVDYPGGRVTITPNDKSRSGLIRIAVDAPAECRILRAELDDGLPPTTDVHEQMRRLVQENRDLRAELAQFRALEAAARVVCEAR